MKKTWFVGASNEKFDFSEYLHSSMFAQDFMPVRTGDDEFEWTAMTAQRGWEIEILDGIPLHVKTAARHSGTARQFAKFIGRRFEGVDNKELIYFLQRQPIVKRK